MIFLLYYFITIRIMNCKIVKSTTKGQVTLPVKWREKFNTDNFFMIIHKNHVVLKPVKLEEFEEEVLFDAETDNNGKGVTPDEMIKMLKELN